MPYEPSNPIITWPCYEPAGSQIELSEADLVQHVVVIGSTGSGKSTLLTSAIRQIISHSGASPRDKTGLLVLDAKADDIVAHVQEAAADAGRSQDVWVFGPWGSHSFDLFGILRSFDDVDLITQRVLTATEPLSRDNAYWQALTTNMFSAAFALLIANAQPITFRSTIDFLRRWFLMPTTPPEIGALMESLVQKGRRSHPVLIGAMDQVKLWQTLENRTRSNAQICLLNVLRPLQSPAAVRSFSPGCPVGDIAAAATHGKICVISVNAVAEAEFAKFFFRLTKQSIFDAVQRRHGAGYRLCGVIADELPLVLTLGDPEQLATVRSKRCFIMAATQGLGAISERLGPGTARALLNNFNTTLFMRSREVETSLQAHWALGARKERMRPKPAVEGGSLGLLPPPSNGPIDAEKPVCPIGALGRLDVHQAFIAFADGSVTEFPVWFVPWFQQQKKVVAAPEKFSAKHVEQLMLRAGFKPRCTPEAVAHAASSIRVQRDDLSAWVQEFFVAKAGMIPQGLDTLPDCWLAALPGILCGMGKSHWIHIPFFINRLALEDGVLLVGYAQEEPEVTARITAWDRIRIGLNVSLYPNRWRQPHHRHCGPPKLMS